MSDKTTEQNEDIVTLTSPEGEDVEFFELAVIELDGAYYSVLQPVELPEDMEEDEAMVFKITQTPEGGENFVLEADDDVIDAVFAEYNRLVETQN